MLSEAKLYPILFALVIGLCACEAPTRVVERGDVVNLYSNSLSASDQKLFAPFEETSGLKVNIISRPGSKVLERVRELEDDSTNADVLLLEGVEYLHQAKQEGMLDTLPNSSYFGAIPSDLKDQQWLSLGYSAYAIAYRPDSVDTLQIQSYQQLANERWDKRLVLAEDEEAYMSLLASLLADEGREGTQNWWDNLSQRQTIRPDSLSLLQLDNTANYRRAPNWLLHFPRPETYLQVTGVAIRGGAPHPARAEMLFNYIFSREFIRRFTEKHRLYPSRTDVQVPAALPPREAFQADTTPQHDIADFTSEARSLLKKDTLSP